MKWIKCSDQIPDAGTPVIIFTRGQVRVAVIFENPGYRDDFLWSIWSGYEFEVKELTCVRWWMPLPPAPETQP